MTILFNPIVLLLVVISTGAYYLKILKKEADLYATQLAKNIDPGVNNRYMIDKTGRNEEREPENKEISN